MTLHSSVRALLLSLLLAIAGLAAVVGLPPLSGDPSVATAGRAPALPTTALPTTALPITARPTTALASTAVGAAAVRHASTSSSLPTAPVRGRVVPPAVDMPEAADILQAQRAAGLECVLSRRGVPLCTHGDESPAAADDSSASVHVPGESSTFGGGGSGPQRIGCYGDGTSGPRVRAVYARPQGAPDRYASSLASIRGWAAAVSHTFEVSAGRTGGHRHVRFATTAGSSCTLVVLNVVLPDSAFASFQSTIDALEARGLDAPSSKYLVWADTSRLCGIATTYADDRPGLDNLNNSALPGYARVDRRCWGKAETHEVVHLLGGVQRSAPNATAGYHCNDGHDVMCYDDGTAGSRQRSVCGSDSARLLDCRNDDYFSTSPRPGSYLATRWNTARSAFLAATLNEAPPAARQPQPAAPKPSPSPSASASPSPSPRPPGVPVPVVPPLPPLPPLPSLPSLP